MVLTGRSKANSVAGTMDIHTEVSVMMRSFIILRIHHHHLTCFSRILPCV